MAQGTWALVITSSVSACAVAEGDHTCHGERRVKRGTGPSLCGTPETSVSTTGPLKINKEENKCITKPARFTFCLKIVGSVKQGTFKSPTRPRSQTLDSGLLLPVGPPRPRLSTHQGADQMPRVRKDEDARFDV